MQWLVPPLLSALASGREFSQRMADHTALLVSALRALGAGANCAAIFDVLTAAGVRERS
jgi:hypothetical protein